MQRHFTATVYIIRPKEVLLIFHPKLKKWLPPGGHLEENETPSECAKREALEETGLQVDLIKQENLWLNYWNASSIERPYLCLLENIPPHGNTPAHQHIDFIFLGKPINGHVHAHLIEEKSLNWFSQDQIDLLSPDQEIFAETKSTIHHILTHVKIDI